MVASGGKGGGIADLYGNIVARENKPLILEKGVEAVLEQLEEVLNKLIEKKAEGSRLAEIAIGVPALTGQEDLNDLKCIFHYIYS